MESDFVKKMEALGIVGPQTLSGECIINGTCNLDGDRIVAVVQVQNSGTEAKFAYIEVTLGGNEFRMQIPVLPGKGSMESVVIPEGISVGEGMVPCEVYVTDSFFRVLAFASSKVVLIPARKEEPKPETEPKPRPKPKPKRKTDSEPKPEPQSSASPEPVKEMPILCEVSVFKELTVNGMVPVSIGSIKLSTPGGEGASGFLKVAIDGDEKHSTMIWAPHEPKTTEIQVIPEILGGKDSVRVRIDVLQGLNVIASGNAQANIKTVNPVNESRSPLHIEAEMDLKDYVIDVHDTKRLDTAGRVTIALIKFYSREKNPCLIDIDVMFDGHKVGSDRKEINPAYSEVPIAIPQNDLFSDNPYKVSVCAVLRDKDAKLITAPRRTIQFRSKYDAKIRELDRMSAIFTNPYAKCVEDIISEVNKSGVSICGYQGNGRDVLAQFEAIYEKVCDLNIQYNSHTLTLKSSDAEFQRVRTPQSVYDAREANCMDAAIFFASLFERVGLAPVVAMPTGHAIPGIIVAAPKDSIPGVQIPVKVPDNIEKRFRGKILEVPVANMGMEGEGKASVLVVESTLAARKQGDMAMRCDLDYTMDSAVETILKDEKYRTENEKKPVQYSNICMHRYKRVNTVLL